MDDVEELLRLPAPAPRPQALAFDGATLWLGSIETSRIYAIDPATWRAREDGEVPGAPEGKPWGMTVVGDQLRVCCGVGPQDDRVIRTYVPGRGFHGPAIPCPDATGSQLAYDGDRLYLCQWYNRRILALDDAGRVGTIIPLAHQVCGAVVVGGRFFVLSVEDETTNDYWLTRVDARGAAPVCEDLARVPFPARSLAWDGERFWTNHREAHETVAFAAPAGAVGGGG